ncbi:MAG: endonuclease MutS2 [Clostridiales bacterium]|nr:endonuclease MutS2 [Clostridiales bacterium]
MDERVLAKLEYPEVVTMLIDSASTITGKERAGELTPMKSLSAIRLALAETTQAKDLQRLYPMFSLGGVHDLRAMEKKAAMDGIIDSPEFLLILDTLRASERIRTFLKDPELPFPDIIHMAYGLHPLPSLESEISRKITNEGEVADKASQELYRLRTKLRSLQGKAKEKLESMLRHQDFAKYLQDPIISIRGDRYVLPVRAEFRQQVPGIVHDQSGSGATVFIEPLQVVEINNETHQCEIEERAEVIRILRQLTEQVKACGSQLADIRESLTEIDFAMAKGKLSTAKDWRLPIMNDSGRIALKKARHPLIPGKVVPVTVELGRDFDAIVVTGPNTGGKTVLLKTIGLLTLMAQAGLHVPAEDETEIAVFRQIFADIGDEQSIEQSLSTFSSHMNNIISITEKADGDSLVLLDELGAGTDPAEGASLGMAVIEDLLYKQAKIVATTHYSELKSFASSQDRVENASVEFDVETLRPTYRLMMGIPGRSNAFEISLRLGLHPDIIESAKTYQSKEEARAASLIRDLETSQIHSENERLEAAALRKQAADTLAWIERKEADTKNRVASMLEKAQNEALELVIQARKESEALLKEIRDMQKAGYQALNEKAAQSIRESLRKHENQLYDKMESRDAVQDQTGELKPGDMVFLRKLKQKGQVLTGANSQGELTVQAGIIKLTVKRSELELLQDSPATEIAGYRTGAGSLGATKAKTINAEMDLRGKLVEEAIQEAEKYLDDAYLAGLPQISIIHGKGTGALRKAIRDLATKHPFVASARLGAQNEGGDGVTIISLQQ